MEIKDDLLNAIAARAEVEPNYSPGLALLVDGVFISGFVMSSAAFMNALYGSAKAGAGERDPADLEAGKQLPEYIHLKGVRFYAGSGQQIEERTGEGLWRCRISAVSGFKVGTMHFVSHRLGTETKTYAEHI
jgi:hypothetical protein